MASSNCTDHGAALGVAVTQACRERMDTGALEDWMLDVIETAESMSFWLDMKDRIEPTDCQKMLSALRLLNLVMLDRLRRGRELFV